MPHVTRAVRAGLAAALIALALMPVPGSASDEGDGPRGPTATALGHLRRNAARLGVGETDLATLGVTSRYASRHTGVTHVNVQQRHRGLEVFGAHATVSVEPGGGVLFVGDSFVSGLGDDASGAALLEPTDAVAAAAAALGLPNPSDLTVRGRIEGRARRTVVSGGGISERPIPVRLGWQPTAGGLRLAWQLVIDDATDVHLWNATVDAATGELLAVDDWTSDAAPEPVDEGSSYRVFAHPKESPSDGGRTLVTNPADAAGSPFGWHDTSGAAGAEFTVTRGNNVHAYTDRDNNNAPDPGGDPDGGPGLAFDFQADLGEHPQTYTDAAVANLFYWNNLFHDVLYRYGFDEPSGNFQVNNYGRGGVGGDDVQAEAADGGGQNNANFSTPAQDGGRPRMQMYLWPGAQFGLPNAVTIDAGPGAGTYPAQYARFTPAPTSAGISGDIVLAGGVLNDGCLPYSVAPGAIVVAENSITCNFRTKVANAEEAGAGALIVAHNATGTPPVMSGSMDPPASIPAVAVSQADGAAIKAGLPATGSVHKRAEHPAMRDGDFEAGIIIHEYGHGVSNRLTGGPTTNCLSGQEQMGEGWSDYFAITTLLDPTLDDPEGPRGMGPYALFQDSRQGGGIRPRPYSRNMEIQPGTYDGIKTGGWFNGTSLSQPHGIGHMWATVLWDMTWDLIDRHGFNANVYEPWDTGGNNLALQLVVDGLKIQGCGPGFVVGRDAIIAADQALTGGENACTVWAAFARRGLGYSAVQGTTSRNDNMEAFDTHPDCRSGFASPIADPPALNTVEAGRTLPLRFSIGGDQGLDILASNSPYSRQVDCLTLATVTPGSTFTTPRPIPVPATPPGKAGLSYNAGADRYQYTWKTLGDWSDTCREFVLTLDDGRQHRAYFRFVTTL